MEAAEYFMLVRSDLTIRLYSTHQALTLLIASFHLGFGPRLLTFLKPIFPLRQPKYTTYLVRKATRIRFFPHLPLDSIPRPTLTALGKRAAHTTAYGQV